MSTIMSQDLSVHLESAKSSLQDFAIILKSLFGRVQELTGASLAGGPSKTFVGAILIVVGSHIYCLHKFRFWSKRNIKTPTPIPILGNSLSFLINSRRDIELEWSRKYGKLYGYYMGTRPQLVCADAELLKKICVKDFDKFINHHLVEVKNKYQEHFLINQEDNHWRGMRAIMTPTFTSGKIKVMFKLLSECADSLVREYKRRIEENTSGREAGTIVDLRQLFGSFTMSSALKSFYGISLSLNKEQAEKQIVNDTFTAAGFADRTKQAFSPSLWRFMTSFVLPRKLLQLLKLPLMSEQAMQFFSDQAKQIIKRRQASQKTHNDYLQLLLEVKADSSIDLAESHNHEEHHAFMGTNSDRHSADQQSANTFRSSGMKLTEDEVSCQVMMLMMVATETTAILLTHTFYLLAHHPEVQQRLYADISNIQDKQSGEFDYDSLTSCQYLDCVISESLRLMPPALTMDRVTGEDYYIKEYDVVVPKGTIINLSFLAIHLNEEYWPKPYLFDPERFSPENKRNIVPGSYCPFGIGPRACIGFRFALTEAKVGLAKLLTRFQLEPAPGTEYPPKPRQLTVIVNEHENMLVSVKSRRG